MSYSEKDGQVVLTSRQKLIARWLSKIFWLPMRCYLLMRVYLLRRKLAKLQAENDRLNVEVESRQRTLNRLNSGNPNYTPYQVEAENK